LELVAVTNDKLAGKITDDKLNQIRTKDKVANSATTATSEKLANTIVLRDADGKFAADLTG
jgi:hypothetical protein